MFKLLFCHEPCVSMKWAEMMSIPLLHVCSIWSLVQCWMLTPCCGHCHFPELRRPGPAEPAGLVSAACGESAVARLQLAQPLQRYTSHHCRKRSAGLVLVLSLCYSWPGPAAGQHTYIIMSPHPWSGPRYQAKLITASPSSQIIIHS